MIGFEDFVIPMLIVITVILVCICKRNSENVYFSVDQNNDIDIESPPPYSEE